MSTNTRVQKFEDRVLNLSTVELDAVRYRRLRVLGCKPCLHGLSTRVALRFTDLDKFVDDDLFANPSRGEA